MFEKRGKRGQVTIFIIVAIVLVGGLVGYFIFKDSFSFSGVNPEFKPVYDYYEECIKQETSDALSIAGSQGGRIYQTDYEPGSDFSPFSSHLNFLGFQIPYWYYISGNGIIRENIPTKNEMEQEISRYIEENLNSRCDLEQFYEKGMNIELGDPKVSVKINDDKVDVNVESRVVVSNDEISSTKSTYKMSVNSRYGTFYNEAREIYDKEKSESFFESYTIDVLRLYAPVDGVELSCSPKVWKTQEVVDDLQEALQANLGAIRFSGDYYDLSKKNNEYFIVDSKVTDSAQVIYSRDWPSQIEIDGSDGELMIAQPIGNQEGLGILGFCYAPYHFVYDVKFPVLIQLYDNDEVFQFPIVVVIDNNLGRQSNISNLTIQEDFDLCEFKDQEIEVNVYNNELQPVSANVSYSCFDQQCFVGETSDGNLISRAPSCVNGYLVVNADGYSTKKQIFSSNKERVADIILDKEYEVEVNVKIAGREISSDSNAIIFFSGGERSRSVSLKEANKINLAEGSYNLTVYVYANSSIVIPASKKTQCVDAPAKGLSGIFGGTSEQCYDIELPEQKIESALIGGGKSEVYILPSDLEKGKVTIEVNELPYPRSLEQLQYNFETFDTLNVGLNFG